HYVATDGFDKTLIHLSKSAFEENLHVNKQIQEALEKTEGDEYSKTDFKISYQTTNKYIKSNLHPVVFPKEVFQFEVDYKDEKPWGFLKTLTKESNVCAVPFKRKVFAIGTLTDISNLFQNSIKSEIKREPISKYDVENVTAF